MFNKILPMTGVKPRSSGIESDRSTNWATPLPKIVHVAIIIIRLMITGQKKMYQAAATTD